MTNNAEYRCDRLCACGCGLPTKKSTHYKGFSKFLHGHNSQVRSEPGPLPDGLLFDECDRDFIEGLTWSIDSNGYATATIGKKTHRLHRILMMGLLTEGMQVDHINGNRLDNRRENLRAVTRAVNGHNRPANKNSQSGIKNVYPRPDGRWQVQIRRGSYCYSSTFSSQIDAAKAAQSWRSKNLPGWDQRSRANG